MKIGDKVACDIYEMDGCCHDCEGTTHYLEQPVFKIERIEGNYAYSGSNCSGYRLDHIRVLTPLEEAMREE